MKRELKLLSCKTGIPIVIDHKANPDEKGTETKIGLARIFPTVPDHKANPDEKGTETGVQVGPTYMNPQITRLIPMKRELKRI